MLKMLQGECRAPEILPVTLHGLSQLIKAGVADTGGYGMLQFVGTCTCRQHLHLANLLGPQLTASCASLASYFEMGPSAWAPESIAC